MSGLAFEGGQLGLELLNVFVLIFDFLLIIVIIFQPFQRLFTGGDEFLVFMEYTGDFEAQVSRVFRAVTGQYGSFYISVSMGVSTLPEHGADYEKLFYAADQALYSSKRGGRNQYKFYDDSMKGTLSVLSPIDGDR